MIQTKQLRCVPISTSPYSNSELDRTVFFFSFSFVIPIPFQPSHLFRTLLPCIELYRLLCNNQISIFCTIFNIQLHLLQSSCFRSFSTQMLRHNLLLRGVGCFNMFVYFFNLRSLCQLSNIYIFIYIEPDFYYAPPDIEIFIKITKCFRATLHCFLPYFLLFVFLLTHQDFLFLCINYLIVHSSFPVGILWPIRFLDINTEAPPRLCDTGKGIYVVPYTVPVCLTV